jgi:fatty-acyl-CoA synthase
VKIPLTPLSFLERAGSVHAPDIGCVEGEARVSYADLAREARLLAGGLLAAGIRPGDRVAWLGPNTRRLLVAYFGVPATGAVLLPLNIRLHETEMAAVLSDAGAAALIADGMTPPPWPPLSYDDLVSGDEAPLVPEGLDEDRPAELFYTSGSTGRPKGAVLTHRALYLHAVHTALTMNLGEEDVVIHTIPLFHVNGWGTPHALTAVGGRHVMLTRFDPATVLRLIAAERVTRLYLVPTMLRMLLAAPELDASDLSSLKGVSLGGAPTPAVMFDEAERRLGAPVYSGYGLTETSPTLLRALPLLRHGPEDEARKRRTTGRPILGVDVSVVDDDLDVVPRDGVTVGEIVARTNHAMEGYWNRPEETAAAFRGGWFHTGDLATWDDEGYVTIVDREKDVIISGGENISSVEVEAVLMAHPAVVEACVVGVADEHWGEVPFAFVTVSETVDAGDLITWCRDQMAHFKVPRDIEVRRDELPKLGTGKIAKSQLREEARARGYGGDSSPSGPGVGKVAE